jgi:hypothetical protein
MIHARGNTNAGLPRRSCRCLRSSGSAPPAPERADPRPARRPEHLMVPSIPSTRRRLPGRPRRGPASRPDQVPPHHPADPPPTAGRRRRGPASQPSAAARTARRFCPAAPVPPPDSTAAPARRGGDHGGRALVDAAPAERTQVTAPTRRCPPPSGPGGRGIGPGGIMTVAESIRPPAVAGLADAPPPHRAASAQRAICSAAKRAERQPDLGEWLMNWC